MKPDKRTALRAVIVLATMGVAVMIVVLFFPWNLLRAPLASYVGHQLGRPVAIAGDLNVKLGWTPRIQVDDVSIGNAAWSSDPQMAHVQRMKLRVELFSLLAGALVVPAIELVEPQVLVPDLTVIDTTAVTINGDGRIDFRDETYDLHLRAHSKKPSLLALRGPIVVGGTFKAPAIHPDAGQVAARLGAPAGLAAITPPLALLALVDFGGAPDVDCRALIADTRLPQGARGNKADSTLQSSTSPGAR